MTADTPQPPLVDAVTCLSRALERDRLKHVIIGGVALAIWGRPRTTVDVDVLVAHESADPEVVLKALETEDFRLAEQGVHREVMLAGFRAFRRYGSGEQTVVPVDVLVSSNPVVGEIVERAKRRPFGGCEVSVPSAEDFIVLKLQAGRLQDLADAQAVLRARHVELDHDHLARQAAVFAVEDLLRRILED